LKASNEFKETRRRVIHRQIKELERDEKKIKNNKEEVNNKMSKKWKVLSKALLIAAFSLTIGFIQPLATDASPIENYLTIAGSSLGGSYMVMSGGLAAFLTNTLKGCTVTARLTGGSSENVRLLEAHQVDLGFANAGVAYQKAKGLGMFEEEASENLSFVALTTMSQFHWVTLADSGIKTVRDLEGKTVSIGPPGGGTGDFANYLLELYDLTDKIKIVQLGFDESAENLKDGNVDAIVIGSPVPSPSVVNLASLHKIHLISTDKEIISEILKEAPYYSEYIIPAGSYQGVEEPVTVIGVGSPILANKEVSKERIYEITKLIFSDDAQKHMKSVYTTWDIVPGIDLADQLGIPLHPGVEQYYQEEGIFK